ncbi:lytic murein transglycosylase [Jhaorihella thermophila]|uniref:Membrane-bound lytic murein transglycosylase B n=1 Tax=Jhaorihella thermophila TaxID=488547 RepID=A0A1H5TAX1_9RHOB|nr:lytic transglycosylase domain-containing protein [Jhaorihella thermophila]SEF59288.1 Membrane-bound lytic murein transglycosylase B [Jhaorihella thermophila]
MKRIVSLGLGWLIWAGAALGAPCGNDASGFEAWKAEFAKEARKAGVRGKGLRALARAQYATRTIAADRQQKSFRYGLEKFMRVRGADAIVAQGRKRKSRTPEFYAALERRYGVSAGILIAIHGMETGFGWFMGDSPVVSAIATLAYDCRRPELFRPHAIGALKLVDRGSITATTLGARHGELGHTQFLPGNALRYGVDGNGDGRVDLYDVTDALASTANYLRRKGWKRGKGYQPGQPNFAVLKEWNAATVYQQALAIMGARIDRP